MTVEEIRIKAQLTTGIPIDSAVGLKWAAEAIEDICKSNENAGNKTIETVLISSAPADYLLKKTLLKIMDIKEINKGYYLASNSDIYTVNNDNTITFAESGNYEITYMALPTLPVNTTDAIPLPYFFALCVEYYLAYKIRGRMFGQDDSNTVAFWQQYMSAKEDAELARRKQKKKRRIPPGRYWC